MLPRTQILVTQDYKTPRDKQHNSTLRFQGFSIYHAMRIMCHEWNVVLFVFTIQYVIFFLQSKELAEEIEPKIGWHDSFT